MARHRSPVGRSALPPSPYAAATSAEGERRGAHRSGNTTLRRGATAVAVATGAFSLVGAGVPVVIQASDGATPDLQPELTSAYTALPAAGTQAAPQQVALPDTPVRSSIQPVAMTVETAVADGAALVKAAQLHEQALAEQAAQAAEQQRIAEERARAEAEAQRPRANNNIAGCEQQSDIGAVKPWVRDAANFLGCTFDVSTIYGVASRASASEHPGGLALDLMVDKATGTQLAQCALDNQEALGIKYVITQQQINTGSGWKDMEDRGSITANHMDHVHISFESGAGTGGPISC